MEKGFYARNLGVNLPVLHTWSLGGLRFVFLKALRVSAAESMLCNGGRIFVALSGGLDSSYCVAALRNQLGADCAIDTFTVGSSEQHPDVVHARMVAELFKTEHHCLIPDQKQIRQVDRVKKLHPELFVGSEKRSGHGVFLLMQMVKEHAKKIGLTRTPALITHDGIDELLGGYWEHRKHKTRSETERAFETLWSELPQKHLLPLRRKANFWGVIPLHPYLHKSVVEYISYIPVDERTSRAESKIPLRRLAESILPPEIISRRKLGFCDAMVSVEEINQRA